MEEVTALYGWRRIQTPGFEDTGLFARTSGEASDVVHKEMYTFTDRSDRSLTLRPEGTAPICRAYIEHGMHREPQPVKAYTIAPMYRYGAPGPRPLPRALPAVRRGDRLGRPGDRRGDHPALPRAAAPARRHEVGAAPELDRRRELPSAVRRAAERLARRARRRARRGRAPQARDEPAAGVRRQDARPCAPRSRTRRRSASRSATSAARTSTPCARQLDLYGVPYVLDPTLVRGLDYYSRTTFEFIGPDENANSTICGGGRYDGLVEADRRPADARNRLRRRPRAAAARARERGHHRRRSRALDVFFVVDEPASARRRPAGARRAAPRRDLRRHRLRRPLVQGADDAGGPERRAHGRDRPRRRARRSGATARDEQPVALGEVVATLTA